MHYFVIVMISLLWTWLGEACYCKDVVKMTWFDLYDSRNKPIWLRLFPASSVHFMHQNTMLCCQGLSDQGRLHLDPMYCLHLYLLLLIFSNRFLLKRLQHLDWSLILVELLRSPTIAIKIAPIGLLLHYCDQNNIQYLNGDMTSEPIIVEGWD